MTPRICYIFKCIPVLVWKFNSRRISRIEKNLVACDMIDIEYYGMHVADMEIRDGGGGSPLFSVDLSRIFMTKI